MKLSVKLSEAQIQRSILEYLTLRGIFAWRNNSGAVKVDGKRFMRFGMPGSTDILGILEEYTRPGHAICDRGVFLAIEVKSAKGKLSPAQESFRDAVKLSNGLYVEAHSLADVERALEGLK